MTVLSAADPLPGATTRAERENPGGGTVALLAVLIAVLGALAIDAFVVLLQRAPAENGTLTYHLAFGLVDVKLTADGRLVMLTLVAAALGSWIHVGTSFTKHVGVRDFDASWTTWYLFRLLIGPALAGIFYLTIRAGFLSSDTSGTDPATGTGFNTYAFAAVGAFAGLFAKQATDKLAEVFDTFFNTGTQAKAVVPQVKAVKVTDGDPLSIVVDGSGFTANAVILVEQRPVKTAWDGPTRLTALLPRENVGALTRISVSVINPSTATESTPLAADVP